LSLRSMMPSVRRRKYLRNGIATRASLPISQIPVTIEMPRPSSTYRFMTSQPPTSGVIRYVSRR
jgi:hypothetical protein